MGIAHEALVVEQHIREGRFQRSLALITAFASLIGGLEVTLEHYRGSYSQQVMYTPVGLSGLLMVAGLGTVISRRAARLLLPVSSALLLLDGILGFYFHIRGIARKPGGWRIPVVNVVLGPPLFAPLLLALNGYLGLIASILRREDDLWVSSPPGPLSHSGRGGDVGMDVGTVAPSLSALGGVSRRTNFIVGRRGRMQYAPTAFVRLVAILLGSAGGHGKSRPLPHVDATTLPHHRGLFGELGEEAIELEHRIREGRFQKNLAVVAGCAGLLSGLEALYSHYENDYAFPIEQWSPVVIAPLLFLSGLGTVWSRTVAKTLLPVTSLLALIDGTLGGYYHLRGALKRPGGVGQPLYNALYGPPLFAPLLLAASGFLGLVATFLRRAD